MRQRGRDSFFLFYKGGLYRQPFMQYARGMPQRHDTHPTPIGKLYDYLRVAPEALQDWQAFNANRTSSTSNAQPPCGALLPELGNFSSGAFQGGPRAAGRRAPRTAVERCFRSDVEVRLHVNAVQPFAGTSTFPQLPSAVGSTGLSVYAPPILQSGVAGVGVRRLPDSHGLRLS
jgi:hypothetical protein